MGRRPVAASDRSTTDESVLAFLDRLAPGWIPYGAGKTALRDCLQTVREPGGEVLVPQIIPDAVIEPIRQLRLTPRFYRVTTHLEPDRSHLEDQLGDSTVAVLVVDYFGFPCDSITAVRDLARMVGAVVIEDAAHGPISIDGSGQLLGTRTSMGIASLPKLFDVPNGGIYHPPCSGESAGGRTADAGVAGRYGLDDCRYLVGQALSCFDREIAIDPGSPAARYDACRGAMSRLTCRRLQSVHPRVVRGRRRANYRAWLVVLAGIEWVDPVLPSLPPGVCPLGIPVHADRRTELLEWMRREGVQGYSWPRLPASVGRDSIAEGLAVLPVDGRYSPRSIRAIVR